MERTSFSLLGFTQPLSALPIIQDSSNNAKGFTSRILWYFPQPVFAKFEDTILNDHETNKVDTFKERFGNMNIILIILFLISLQEIDFSTALQNNVTVIPNMNEADLQLCQLFIWEERGLLVPIPRNPF